MGVETHLSGPLPHTAPGQPTITLIWEWSVGAEGGCHGDGDGGDVDGDGLADILIGARNAGDRHGRGYLVLGSSIRAGTFDLTDADMRFLGESRLDEAGYTVSSAGDVNGDGLHDILVASWQANSVEGGGEVDAGAGLAYLILVPSE